MAVLEVLTYPHPLLKQKIPETAFSYSRVERLFKDLVDTLRHHRGCVGLAAPQLGLEARALVVDVSSSPRAQGNHGLLCLLNPQITEATQWKVGREGCLSFPDLLANIKRAQNLKLTALGVEGKPLALHCRGFEAVALQHEMDHLDGIVLLDRIRSSRDLFERVK